MEAKVVDLRRNTGKILKALEQREHVTISRRGKPVARMVPVDEATETAEIFSHPAFGMWSHAQAPSVAESVREMRKGRFHDL